MTTAMPFRLLAGGLSLKRIALGPRARAWLAAQALADGADVCATLAARRRLPVAGFRFALAVASGSTVIGAVSAVALGRG